MGVTTCVDVNATQEHRLHPWGEHGIARVDGKLTIPDLVGQTDLPLLRGVVLVGAVTIRYPAGRSLCAQDFMAHALAPAGADDMETDRGIRQHPFPLRLAGARALVSSRPIKRRRRKRGRMSATR